MLALTFYWQYIIILRPLQIVFLLMYIGGVFMLPSSTNHTKYITSTNCQTNLNGIDLMKFLCSILVFLIHITPFQGELSGFANHANIGLRYFLCRIAVPFYFVCSGFFLFRKMSIDHINIDVIKSYCFKILRLLGTWRLLLFIGDTKQLWYLGASVIAIILVSLCFHFHLNTKLIGVLACLLYAIGLLGDSYQALSVPLADICVFRYLFKGYTFAFGITRNGVFMGFIFVLMGAILSHHKKLLKPLPSALGFLLSMACLFVEGSLLISHGIPGGYNMYVFLLPATYFFFSFAYTIPLKDHAIYRHLRSIGMLIYFLHLFVDVFVITALNVLDKHLHITMHNHRFILSFACTLLLAVFIDWLSGKDKFKWLKWLLA